MQLELNNQGKVTFVIYDLRFSEERREKKSRFEKKRRWIDQSASSIAPRGHGETCILTRSYHLPGRFQ